MNAQEKAKLIERETNAFLPDERFGGLDTSSSPDFNSVPKEGFGTDRHGLNVVVESGSNQLRALADNPDEETIKRIADETGNADLAEHIKDQTEGAIAEEFVRTHRTYYICPENYTDIREWLDDRQLQFTLENLDLAFKTLTRAGQLETKPGTARALQDFEALHIIDLCKSGQLEDAISQFLTYSLPGAERRWSDTNDFITDPDTVAVRNNACRFVWFHSNPVQDSTALRAFERTWFRARPIKTVADYQTCYTAFLQHEKEAARDRIVFGDQPTNEPVTRNSLEDLSDDQVNALTQRTLQARAKQLAKGNRVIA